VTDTRLRHDPYLHDPARWGVSLAQMSELLLPCLDAVGARSVAEVGAYAGDLTRVLADWAAERGAQVLAIDPAPQPGLVELADAGDAVELVRQTSLEALPRIPLPDAIVLDGDHNYWTVSRELALIAERASGEDLPLLMFHDVCWPHARRDDYFDPAQIPAEARHPVAGQRRGIVPGEPGLRHDGLPYPKSAAHEGGPGNGVLTAAEDFVASQPGVRLAVVPAFFGFGVAWHEDAPWAAEVAALIESYDNDPILQRLEANRVHHLAQGHAHLVELWAARDRIARQEALLRRMLESSAFAVAERLSRVRSFVGVAPAQSVISKAEIRQLLAQDPQPGDPGSARGATG
jgi:hypothetical protein